MNRQSLKFDPTIAAIAKPSGENWGTALAAGLVKLGAVANQMHDRQQKEMLQNAAEQRAAESHAQRMTKGAMDIDYKSKANPLRLRGLALGNARTRQVMGQSAQSHVASMREKGWAVSSVPGMGSFYGGGCSGGNCSSAVSGGFDGGVETSVVSGGCADGNCGSAVSESVQPDVSSPVSSVWGSEALQQPVRADAAEESAVAGDDSALGMRYIGKPVKPTTQKLTTAQKNYLFAKQDPAFAEFLNKSTKKSKTGKTYAPTPAMKAYQEDIASLPEDQRETWKKEHPFIDYRKSYLQTKKMTGGLTTAGIIAKRTEKLAQKLGVENLAEANIDEAIAKKKISPTEVQTLVRKMAVSDQAKVLDREMAKKAGALSEIAGLATRFSRYAKSGNVDTNFVRDKKDIVKSYVPGLDYNDADLENEEFRRDYMNISTVMLKLQSGLTVSDKERANFERSLGTLSKNKRFNFIGLKQKLLDTLNNYQGIATIDPVYFNLKYGKKLRQLDGAISMIDNYLHHKTDNGGQNNAPKLRDVAETPQKRVVETRVLPDGRKLARYSDGTIGEIK